METRNFRVVITDKPLDIQEAQRFVSDPAFGAITSFTGIVRNNNEGRGAEAVTYDLHEKLAVKALEELCAEAIVGAGCPVRIYVAHAFGRLKVGAASVIISVGTPHRKAAFDICEQIIDRLKEKAPVWKNEHYLEGDSAWLAGTPLATPEHETMCCGGCGSLGKRA